LFRDGWIKVVQGLVEAVGGVTPNMGIGCMIPAQKLKMVA